MAGQPLSEGGCVASVTLGVAPEVSVRATLSVLGVDEVTAAMWGGRCVETAVALLGGGEGGRAAEGRLSGAGAGGESGARGRGGRSERGPGFVAPRDDKGGAAGVFGEASMNGGVGVGVGDVVAQ